MKKKRHTTAHQKAVRSIKEEGRRQCFLLYGSTAIALKMHYGKGRQSTMKLFDATDGIWNECTQDITKSAVKLCEDETGIEIQCGNGKSWHDLPYLNGSLDDMHMSNAQWIYMRHQQVKWVSPQIMAIIMLALHRQYGFGFRRLSEIYAKIQDIESQHGYSPERVRKACMETTGIDVKDIYLRQTEE